MFSNPFHRELAQDGLRGLTVPEMCLEVPMEHILGYEPFLLSLKQETDIGHFDHGAIQTILSIMENLKSTIQERHSKEQSQLKFLKLHNNLVFPPTESVVCVNAVTC